MTVIAACIDQDASIWMGCDTISLHRGNNVKRSAESKIFRLGEMLVGASGTVHAGQIVEHHLGDLSIPDEENLIPWLVREFIVPLRVAMKEYGGECKNRDGDNEMDGRLLIGLRGRLFEVDCGYGIYPHASCFAAIGCADQEALAGMFIATKLKPEMHARGIVMCGLEAAAEYDINIRPPFEVMCDLHENVAGLRAVR